MAKRNRTHLETISLIECVKKNPPLWDCRNEQYKLAENKPAIWQGIAEEVNCSKGMFIIVYKLQRAIKCLYFNDANQRK